MKDISLKELKPRQYFTKFAFLDGNFVLLAPETPVTQELINRLARWEFREIKTEGEAVDAMVERSESSAEETEATADEEKIPADAADDEKLDAVLGHYRRFHDYVEELYTNFVTKNTLDYRELLERTKALYEIAVQEKTLILRALADSPTDKNYLVSHSVRSAILSIVIGAALKLPPFRLIELGAAAVLHEIGMVKLPPQLYMAGRQLSQVERKSITAHPVLGYNLLKEQQIPLAVCLSALEHHERMNGSGYPRSLTGDKISLYSRIIMVACSYDAVTANRPYKEAKEGYAGMVDILRNEGKQYDESVIRALVYNLSIYPIGSFVLLTNGKKAVVIDVNPENPRYPVVQVLGAKTPEGKDIVVRTAETGLRVLRPLAKAEIPQKENV